MRKLSVRRKQKLDAARGAATQPFDHERFFDPKPGNGGRRLLLGAGNLTRTRLGDAIQ